MKFQPAIQTAGSNSVSDIFGQSVYTNIAEKAISLDFNYNKVGDNFVTGAVIPASFTALATNPTNNYRSNSGTVVIKNEYLTSYNRLSQTFSGIIRTVPFTSITNGMVSLLAIDPATTTNKLLRLVLRSGATANATIKIYIMNATGIFTEINTILPVANTEYVIDDINWQNNGTYGVLNTPITIDGQSKATTTAVVTSTGTFPANGSYNSFAVTGTLSGEIINATFYNNEAQKYGGKLNIKFCCKSAALTEFTKEIIDIKCGEDIVNSYTKKKDGKFTVTVQKLSTQAKALLEGSDNFEVTALVRTKSDTLQSKLSGSNLVVAPSSTSIFDVAYDCQAMSRTVDNLTSQNLVDQGTEYYYSFNTTTNEIVLPLTFGVGVDIEVGYFESKILQGYDPMQIMTDLPFLWTYNVDSVDGKYVNFYSLSTISSLVKPKLADESDSYDLEFKVSASENLNLIGQYKK